MANFFLAEENKLKHLVTGTEEILGPYQKLYAWVLDDVKAYDPPVSWQPTPGAVLFCNVKQDAAAAEVPKAKKSRK